MSNKFLKGVFLGGIAGILSALTIAPQSGKKARETLKKLFKKSSDLAKKTKKEIDTEIAKFKEEHKESLANIKKEFQSRFEKVKNEVSKIINSSEKAIKKTKSKIVKGNSGKNESWKNWKYKKGWKHREFLP